MTSYVDRLQQWPSKLRAFRATESCHLIADTLDELHAMATAIGMKRAWFQDAASAPHYDLVPSRRAHALRLGAVELDRAPFVMKCREIRGCLR